MMMKWISVKYVSLKKISDENYRYIELYSCKICIVFYCVVVLNIYFVIKK